ncbi:MAG: intradiol ring-cleavage dioxygenase, partial [Bacteroidetes bacterium]|nr:intradiol ring-cleavage dioxygenase [Bacteroidota bacterium]
GSGTLRVLLGDSMQIAEHDIVLGLNIPNYPVKQNDSVSSGLNIGEDQPSFSPYHAFGPDKGSTACPVCKYGRYQGIIYFAGNNPDWEKVKKWLQFLEEQSNIHGKYLKAYFVYGTEAPADRKQQQSILEKLGNELNIRNTALTFVPYWQDKKTEVYLNKINPSAENTFIIYKHRSIVDKYINLQPTASDFAIITAALSRTRSAYFNIPEPAHE